MARGGSFPPVDETLIYMCIYMYVHARTWIMETSLAPSPMARVILSLTLFLTSLTTSAFCRGDTLRGGRERGREGERERGWGEAKGREGGKNRGWEGRIEGGRDGRRERGKEWEGLKGDDWERKGGGKMRDRWKWKEEEGKRGWEENEREGRWESREEAPSSQGMGGREGMR